jgi:hypothetical protein
MGHDIAENYESPTLAITILRGLADSHSGLRPPGQATITNQNDSSRLT